MPDYSVAKNLQVQWTHTQDAKANPYNNFSASVNFKTAGYNRSNINSYYNVQANAENTTSSSINYTQRFPDSPWNIGLNNSNHKKRPIKCNENNMCFESVVQASKELHCDRRSIFRVLKGEVKNIKNMTFSYITYEELKEYRGENN